MQKKECTSYIIDFLQEFQTPQLFVAETISEKGETSFSIRGLLIEVSNPTVIRFRYYFRMNAEYLGFKETSIGKSYVK